MAELLLNFREPDGREYSFSRSWAAMDAVAGSSTASQAAIEQLVLRWLADQHRVAPTGPGSEELRRYVTEVMPGGRRMLPPPTILVGPLASVARPATRRRRERAASAALDRLLHGQQPLVVACDSVRMAADLLSEGATSAGWLVFRWTTANSFVPEPTTAFANWRSPHTIGDGQGGVIYPHATPLFERGLHALTTDSPTRPALFLFCDPPFERLPDSAIVPFLAEIARRVGQNSEFRVGILRSDDRIPPEMGGDWALTRLNVRSATPILDRYGTNLCDASRAGQPMAAFGIDELIRRIVVVLNAIPGVRSSPVLVGRAGTGKTAAVLELARRLAQTPVDPSVASLEGREIISLNTARMYEAAGRAGGLPALVNALAAELVEAEQVILFIDEIHQLASQAGPGLAIGEILKEALGRGLPVIGATTADEWSAHIEKDRALYRRLEEIRLREMTRDEMVEVLQAIWVPRFADEKGIAVSRDVLQLAATLADRFLPGIARPSRGVYMLDRAATYLQLAGTGRAQLREEDLYVALRDRLGRGMSPADQRLALQTLEQELSVKLIGQHTANERIAEVIEMYFAELAQRTSPLVVLAIGTTGTGKTKGGELVHAAVFPGPPIISIDLSEYGEPHSVATLLGSPPGYVLSDQGSTLARLIKEANGLSVVRLDEFEKAHPDVRTALLGIFDNGTLTPRDGSQPASFMQSIFWITSNLVIDPDVLGGDPVELEAAIEFALTDTFRQNPQALESVRPLLGRIDVVVPFLPLERPALISIARNKLDDLVHDLERGAIPAEYTDALAGGVADAAERSAKGARPIAQQVASLGGRARRIWRHAPLGAGRVILDWDAARSRATVLVA